MPDRPSGGRGGRDGAPIRRAAAALRAVAGPPGRAARPPARGAEHRLRPQRRRPAGSVRSSASRCSACAPRRRGTGRCCASWTTRSGSTEASAQALAFVARRLDAESVALVLAIREIGDESELPGLPDMTVRGLTDADARALLESAIHVQLDERVRSRIVAETRGNPLALLELPRAMTPAELAGGYGVPEAMPMASRIEQGFRRRLESLPPETRRLLLTAAAEPVGDATLVWRAAERLGIGRRGGGGRLGSGTARDRRARPVPASARALGGLPRVGPARTAGGPSGAGRCDRPGSRPRPQGVASRARDGPAGRGRRRGARALGVPGGGPWRHRGGGRLPRASGGADPGSGLPRRAGAGRRPGQVRVGGPGRRARAAGARGAVPAGGARARAAGAVARGDRVRPHARPRRSGAAARCRPAPRAARRGDGPRDLSRGDGGGDVRRSPRRRTERPRGRRGRAGRTGGAAAAARRSTCSLDGLATRFTEGYAAGVPPLRQGARGVPGRERVDGTRPALALAGVSPGPGPLGRRALVRARDARRARRAGDGHAQRAPERGHVSRGPPRSRGSLRRRFVADRGGRRDHAGDRDGAAEVRDADAGRVARPRGRGPRTDRGREDRGDGQGRGHGAGRQRVDHRTALQRSRPLPGRARRSRAGLRARRSSRSPRGPWWS